MNGVNYASGTVPPDYRCASCGAHGCKLWRPYQTTMPRLLCVVCAEQDQGDRLDTSSSDQIGWYVPAVPMEEGDGFWGYTSVPAAGVAWWKSLPMALPMPKPLEFKTLYGIDASGDR
jgi:hypothetical protein